MIVCVALLIFSLAAQVSVLADPNKKWAAGDKAAAISGFKVKVPDRPVYHVENHDL
ncbi:MAG: hypothetical protein GX141_07510 [Armatimonadetes bacterium]|nr:hypothetical protein [Armatimonadota bacterium]